MIIEFVEKCKRTLKSESISGDLVIVGGGMTGVCAAITAARQGVKVVLVQDRPVLGGNGSSEVRLWVLGASSHMGNNNRWAREGGVIDEILVENTYRNPEGNPVLFDMVIMDKVLAEKNITLLLNTVVFDLEKAGDRKIASINAFNPQNETKYNITGKLFCDSSGDGIIAYLAGASYRIGAEEREEFKEGFSPTADYGNVLGQSMFLYTKTLDHPVKYVAPEIALKDITAIPKFNKITPAQWGCNYWWFEYGGRLDTIHDTEKIKFELWKVIYGAWDYIKNSGKFPEAENMSLEWVGVIPGKRESRRFEGLYMLTQKDIVEQVHHEDAVSFGGWAVDLHPADGVYSPLPSCTQYHSKGVFQIPYRCFVSKDIDNLFISGRILSASHVAFGSTRVMATAAHGGQVVGMAAAIALNNNCAPKALQNGALLNKLQHKLNVEGQSIPLIPIDHQFNLASKAKISSNDSMILTNIPFSDDWMGLEYSACQMLPLKAATKYNFKVKAKAQRDTTLKVQLYISSKVYNHTPDVELESMDINLTKGEQEVNLAFNSTVPSDQYGYIIFRLNNEISLGISDMRYSGILSLLNKFNYAVNNNGKQIPPADSGFESFEFWCPERRPKGHNIAMDIAPAIECFGVENIVNGFVRPAIQPNVWMASLDNSKGQFTIEWDNSEPMSKMRFYLDCDYDQPMESVQYGHYDSIMPFCVRNITIKDGNGDVVGKITNNHLSIADIYFPDGFKTSKLLVEVEQPSENVPAAVFGVYIE